MRQDASEVRQNSCTLRPLRRFELCAGRWMAGRQFLFCFCQPPCTGQPQAHAGSAPACAGYLLRDQGKQIISPRLTLRIASRISAATSVTTTRMLACSRRVFDHSPVERALAHDGNLHHANPGRAFDTRNIHAPKCPRWRVISDWELS